MFGRFKPRLPITEEQRLWVDQSFLRLAAMLGKDRMMDAPVFLPIPQHFPDPWERSEAGLRRMFERVAYLLEVDITEVDLELFDNEHDITRSLVPFYSGGGSGAAGVYQSRERVHIGVSEAQLKNPLTLVATLAHELGHVILLHSGLVAHDEFDMEPLNDLLTVFLGFGVFNANAAFQFEQFMTNQSQGWSHRRQGYLSEELFGYALARFAYERREDKPLWAKHLSTNISAYFKRSSTWLQEAGTPLFQ